MKLSFEKSTPGRKGASVPGAEPRPAELGPMARSTPPIIPEMSELDALRHFHALARASRAIEDSFYPLGSCTMKYNPAVCDEVASLPGFRCIHPLAPEETVQGALRVLHSLADSLCRLTAMDAFSLLPAAGAHGELVGMMMVKKHFELRGEKRTRVLVPDTAHGTNPASAAQCGFAVEEVPSGADGRLKASEIRRRAGNDLAAIMLTNPNTLGVFEDEITEVAGVVHECGGLLYYDGANLNALLGRALVGKMGFDIVHLNLHKTFATPHGGGGPGGGPVGARGDLVRLLPVPRVIEEAGRYGLSFDEPDSIGFITDFLGPFLVCLRAWTYLSLLGEEGLREVSGHAVLNANYLLELIRKAFSPFPGGRCMHEFVVSCERFLENGASAFDIAKRLTDYGFHPPTVHFPLTVREALMIEPTETESRSTLDEFAGALLKIADEARTHPQVVRDAPHHSPVERADEVRAARRPRLVWKPPG